MWVRIWTQDCLFPGHIISSPLCYAFLALCRISQLKHQWIILLCVPDSGPGVQGLWGGIQFLSLRSFQPSRQSRESLSHILLLEASLGVEEVDPGLGGHWPLCLAMGGVCQCSLWGSDVWQGQKHGGPTFSPRVYFLVTWIQSQPINLLYSKVPWSPWRLNPHWWNGLQTSPSEAHVSDCVWKKDG